MTSPIQVEMLEMIMSSHVILLAMVAFVRVMRHDHPPSSWLTGWLPFLYTCNQP